jgi:heterotetrameric sarcosine oxidase gamma subunit
MSDKPEKHTPIFTAAKKMGAQFVDEAGWQVANVFSSAETEIAAAKNGVGLADMSPRGKIVIEGEKAEAVLQAVWSIPSLAIGQGAAAGAEAAGADHVYRLRTDRFYISTPPGVESEAVQALIDAQLAGNGNTIYKELFTVTDITHGRSELLLVGPASAKLLSRLCGLDFHPAAFPNSTAKQSSVAKTSQLIIHKDLEPAAGSDPIEAFSLIGSRSLGAYLWDTLLEAGRDLDITPLGLAALEKIGG